MGGTPNRLNFDTSDPCPDPQGAGPVVPLRVSHGLSRGFEVRGRAGDLWVGNGGTAEEAGIKGERLGRDLYS